MRHRNVEAVKDYSDPTFEQAYKKSVMGLKAVPSTGRKLITEHGEQLDFVSCSYLGLDRHPALRQAALDAIESFGGIQWSCARTRLNHNALIELERELNLLWSVRSIAFTTVSAANAAVLPLLASGLLTDRQRPTCVIDKRAHASIQFLKPILAEETRVLSIDSGDYSQLEDLCKANGSVAFITDGVNSMGGAADMAKLVELQDRYDLFLYIDDAHGVSIQGEFGCGYAMSRLPLGLPRTIVSVSQSKGFGSTGGLILTDSLEREAIIRRYGQPYAFSVAPSIPAVAASLASVQIHRSCELIQLQEKLIERIERFDALVPTSHVGNQLPIRMIEIGDESHAVDCANTLMARGFYVSAVFFPTVARGRASLRICLSAAHENEDIDRLAAVIQTIRSTMAVDDE